MIYTKKKCIKSKDDDNMKGKSVIQFLSVNKGPKISQHNQNMPIAKLMNYNIKEKTLNTIQSQATKSNTCELSDKQSSDLAEYQVGKQGDFNLNTK